MNVEDVKAFVAEVCDAAAAGDNEKAHTIKDELYLDILLAISKGVGNPQELASEALKVEKVNIGHYYA